MKSYKFMLRTYARQGSMMRLITTERGAAEGREANRQTYRGGSKSYSLSGQSMQKKFIDTRKHRHEQSKADYENKNF